MAKKPKGAGDYFNRLFHGGGASPDFEQIVKAVLATFAVFTGFVLSSYIKDTLTLSEFTGWFGWTAWFRDWRVWAFFALMALMLRYIIGSAIHLTFMYVPVEKSKQSRSKSVIFLFKDLIFLVMFGLIAMSVSAAAHKTGDHIDLFMERAMLFVGAGFLWSILDAALRGLWGRRWPDEKPGYFWIVWSCLDLLQLAVTYILLRSALSVLCKAELLAAIYVIFLFLDVKAAIRAVQVHD